jgi:hypothetical protein
MRTCVNGFKTLITIFNTDEDKLLKKKEREVLNAEKLEKEKIENLKKIEKSEKDSKEDKKKKKLKKIVDLIPTKK